MNINKSNNVCRWALFTMHLIMFGAWYTLWSDGKNHKGCQYTNIIGCIIDASFSHFPVPNSIKLPLPLSYHLIEARLRISISQESCQMLLVSAHLRWSFAVVVVVPMEVKSRGVVLQDGRGQRAVTRRKHSMAVIAARYSFDNRGDNVVALRAAAVCWRVAHRLRWWCNGVVMGMNAREWWWSLTMMVQLGRSRFWCCYCAAAYCWLWCRWYWVVSALVAARGQGFMRESAAAAPSVDHQKEILWWVRCIKHHFCREHDSLHLVDVRNAFLLRYKFWLNLVAFWA